MMKARVEMALYGAALIAAIAGGAWAIASRPEESAPARLAGPEEPSPLEEPPYVPELPAVPDLATEPPPPRPADDPRMASLGAEMRSLSRARELLEDRPADALAILEEHRRDHPEGVLGEEREAFAIEALLSLDQRPEAERRYTDFLRRFPRSDFSERLATLMR